MERVKMTILAILGFEKPGADRHAWLINRQPMLDRRHTQRTADRISGTRCRNEGDVRLEGDGLKTLRASLPYSLKTMRRRCGRKH